MKRFNFRFNILNFLIILFAVVSFSCSRKENQKKANEPQFIGRYYTDEELDSLEIPEITFPQFNKTSFITQLNGKNVKTKLNTADFLQTNHFTVENYGGKQFWHLFLDDTEETDVGGPRSLFDFPAFTMESEKRHFLEFTFNLKESSDIQPRYLYLVSHIANFPKANFSLSDVYLKGSSLYIKAHDLPGSGVEWQDLSGKNYYTSEDIYLGEYEFGTDAKFRLEFSPKDKTVTAALNGNPVVYKYSDKIEFEKIKSHFQCELRVSKKNSDGLFYEMFVSDVSEE